MARHSDLGVWKSEKKEIDGIERQCQGLRSFTICLALSRKTMKREGGLVDHSALDKAKRSLAERSALGV